MAARSRKHRGVVVLEGMFSLQELEDDPTLLLDLKEDVREECETLGEVTNVTLYDVCALLRVLALECRQLTLVHGRAEGRKGRHDSPLQGRTGSGSLHSGEHLSGRFSVSSFDDYDG